MLVWVSSDKLYKTTLKQYYRATQKAFAPRGWIFVHFHRSAGFEVVNLHILGGPNIFIQHPEQRSLKQDKQQFSAFITLKWKLHSTEKFCPFGLLSVNVTPAMGASLLFLQFPLPELSIRNSSENPSSYNNPSYLPICLALLLQMSVTTLYRN